MNILSCVIKVIFQRFGMQNGGSTRIVTAQNACIFTASIREEKPITTSENVDPSWH